jgi:hypothetical protein
MLGARLLLALAGAYAALGVAFAAAFVVLGVGRVDRTARGSPWAFRLLILPGAAALWPWLLAGWIRAARAGVVR